MRLARLFAVNALVRVGAAASGQLFGLAVAAKLASAPGLGSLLVGGLAACFFASELLAAPVAGELADRTHPRSVLARGPLFGLASGLLAAGAAAAGSSLGVWALLLALARTNEGLSAAFSVPSTLALLAEETKQDSVRQLRTMGLFEISSLLAMIAGYALSGVAWEHFGEFAFLALPAVYLLASTLVAERSTTPQVRVAAEGSVLNVARGATKVLLGDADLKRFALAWLTVNAVVGAWFSQVPFLLTVPAHSTQTLVGGLSGSEVGLVFAVWGLTFLAGLLGWTLFAGRLSQTKSLGLSLIGMLGVVFSLGLANHGAGSWALIVAVGFVLIESGFTPVALARLATLSNRYPAQRSGIMGLYSMLLAGGQLIGGLLAAPLTARWQMDGLIALTCVFALVALVSILGSRSTASIANR